MDDEVVDPDADFPSVSEDLILSLEARFPNTLTGNLRTPDRELGAKIGRAEVVQFLREMHLRPR